MAIVILGGLVTSTALNLLLLPALCTHASAAAPAVYSADRRPLPETLRKRGDPDEPAGKATAPARGRRPDGGAVIAGFESLGFEVFHAVEVAGARAPRQP